MKIRQSTLTIGAALAFAAIAVALMVSVFNVKSASNDVQRATKQAAAFDHAGTQVSTASDFLTNEVRSYAVSTDPKHLEDYWTEINETKRRDKAVAELKRNGARPEELALVDKAAQNSNALVQTETRAMWLVLTATGTAVADMPPAVGDYKPSAADRALSDDAKLATARRILFDDKYLADKASIGGPIDEFKQKIAARAAHEVRAAEGARDGAITLLLILSVLVALAMGAVLTVFHRSVGTVVSRYSGALRDRDENDREFALEPAGTVELRDLADEFNAQFAANSEQLAENDRLVANLKQVVAEVTGASTTVSSAAQQMSATSAETGRAVGEIASAVGDVAQGAERQVRQLESVRVSADDAATAARTSADQAQEAAQVAERAREYAREGVGAAERATEAMKSVRDSSASVTDAIRELASRSDRIGAIVETITGIAGQTNLLALNAAIEAARAGEQGRGFAVVAEEVRKLAEESQQAAEEISGLIAQIQGDTQTAVGVVQDGAQRTEDGAATVDETRAAFERIGTAVEDVNARIAEIATAAGQISAETTKMQAEIADAAAVAEESSASTEQVSASTQQTSASTQEIAASASELATTAGELERLVGQLQL